MAENAARKQRRRRGPGRRFRPGQSGNPAGRKPGTRNHVSQWVEQLMEADIGEIVRVVIDAAKSGDLRACEIVMARVCPARRSRPTPFALPNNISTSSDILELLSSVVEAMAKGDLSADEGQAIASVIEARRKAIADARRESGGAPQTGMIITIRGGLPDPPEFADPQARNTGETPGI
jgi:Family of unknown function (DUF5681)